MPGGTGAGTVLGLNLFLILFNGAGPEANMTSFGQQVTKPLHNKFVLGGRFKESELFSE